MARIYHTGFEINSTSAGMEYTGSSGTISRNTTTKRTGLAALRTNPSASTGYIYQNFIQSASSGTYYIRAYLYIASAPAANTIIITAGTASGGNTWGVRLNTDRTVTLRTPASTDAATSSALSLNTWYRIEVMFSGSGTGKIMELVIDGTTVGSYTAGSSLGSLSYFQVGVLTSTTADLYWDDIALNNTSGSAQTSYPGAGSLAYLFPNADGDNHAWLKSGGGAGSATNYQDLDENPPDDSTTYLKVTATGDNGKTDDVNVDSSSTAGIGSGDTITLVGVRVRGYYGQTIGDWANMTPRIKSASGGTTTSGTKAYGNTSNTWMTFNGSTAAGYTEVGQEHLISYTDPTTGSAWTPTGTNSIDNMQVGAAAGVTVFNSESRFSAVYAIVEYVPAAGTTTSTSSSTSTSSTSSSTSLSTSSTSTSISTSSTSSSTSTTISTSTTVSFTTSTSSTSSSTSTSSTSTSISTSSTSTSRSTSTSISTSSTSSSTSTTQSTSTSISTSSTSTSISTSSTSSSTSRSTSSSTSTTVLDFTTLGSSDDGNEVVSSGAMDITNDGLTGTVARLDGTNHGGFRIRNVTVAQAATIASATLHFDQLANYSGLSATIGNQTLYGEAADNAGAFTTAASNISGRSRTSATGTKMDDTVTGGNASHNADVTSIVQEIVNRAGWASGNNMSFLFIGTGSAASNWIQPFMWDYFSGTYLARLSIQLSGVTTTSTSSSTSTSSTSSSTSTSISTSTSQSTSTSISTSSTSTSISTSSTSTSISTSSTSTSQSTSTTQSTSTSISTSTSSTSTSQSTSTTRSTSTSQSTSTSSTSTSQSTSTTFSTSTSTSTSSTSTSISTSSTSTSISTSSTSTSQSTSTTRSTSTSISTSSTSTSQSTSTSSTSTSISTSTTQSTSTSISTSSTSTSQSTSTSSTSTSISTSTTQSTSTSISTSSTSTSQSTSTTNSTSTTQSFTTSTSSTSTSISTSSTSSSTSISTSSTSTSQSTSTTRSTSTSQSTSTSSTSTSQSTSTSSTSTSQSTSTTRSTSTSQSTSTSSTSTSQSTSTSSTSTSQSTSTTRSTSTSITTSTSTSSTSSSTSSTSTSISTSTTLPPDPRTKSQITVIVDRSSVRISVQNAQVRIQRGQISRITRIRTDAS